MYPIVSHTNADMQCGASDSVEHFQFIGGFHCIRCAGRGLHEHAGSRHGGGDHALVPTLHALQTHSQDILRLYHVLIGLGNGKAVADVGYSCVPGRSVGVS